MWIIIGAILLLFGLTVFRGAPYVPTHRRQIEQALDLLNLKPGDSVVDLGSGDGIFLKAAAKRGLIAYGYEINPILCLVAWARCWKYHKQVHILWRDFWLSLLPKNTKGVFVFAAGPFMNKVAQKLHQEHKKQPFTVVSYGFAIPGLKVSRQANGLYLYRK